MPSTIAEKYQEPFSRIALRESKVAQFVREVGTEQLSEIQAIEKMVRDDLAGFVERKAVARILEDLLHRATLVKRRLAIFATEDQAVNNQVDELERIRQWAQAMHACASAPLEPVDPAQVPPQTDGPKPEGFMTAAESLAWLASQPD